MFCREGSSVVSEAENVELAVHRLESKFQLHPFLVVGPCTGYILPPDLSLLLRKMGMMISLLPRTDEGLDVIKYMKCLVRCLMHGKHSVNDGCISVLFLS